MLLNPSENKSHNRRMATLILSSVNRADRMIQDLLDTSLIRAGKELPLELTECDLRAIAKATLKDLDSLYGKRFVLKAEQPVVGNWSADGLRRVIENLAINAIKYGGPDKPVTVMISETRKSARLKVHNYGNPLSPEERSRLFTPFQRSRNAQKSGKQGWGIGLTLVRGVVETLRGTLSVESSPKEGTTFTIVLPKSSSSVL